MRRRVSWLLVSILLLLPLAGVTPAASQGKPFDGVTVNVLTFTGPQIAEPLQRRGPDFGKLTGAKINVITVPFSDLYQKVLTDVATGTNSYQASVFDPHWMPDFGSCIAKNRNAQSYWMVWSVAAGYLQAKGTREGSFFDADTMKPLTNNEAFAEALRVYVQTGQYGPPDELNWDVGDSRSGFVTGRCALSIDWGDIGPLAVDPKTSKVQDKVGAVIMPGSPRELDRNTGKLVACTVQKCPYSTGGVNHAPVAAYGGCPGAINKAAPAKVKDAAYAFLSYMSQPAQSSTDVTIGITGFNPYRRAHFTNLAPWLKSGMSAAAAKNYLGAISASLNSANMVLDLRIPHNHRYQQMLLDTAIAKMLAKELNIDQAMKEITDGWEAITRGMGRGMESNATRQSLGIPT